MKFVLLFDEGNPRPFIHVMSQDLYALVWHECLTTMSDQNLLIRNTLRVMQRLTGLAFEGAIYDAYRALIKQDIRLGPKRVLGRSRRDMIYNGILAYGEPSSLYMEALHALALTLVDEPPISSILRLRLGFDLTCMSIHDANWFLHIAAQALGLKSNTPPLTLDDRRRNLCDAVVTVSEARELRPFVIPGDVLLASRVTSLGSKWIPVKRASGDVNLYEHLILILRFGPATLDASVWHRTGACLDMWNELIVHGLHYEGGGFAGFRVSGSNAETCLILGVMAAHVIHKHYDTVDSEILKILKQRVKDAERTSDDELSMATFDATCWRLFYELKFNPFDKVISRH